MKVRAAPELALKHVLIVKLPSKKGRADKVARASKLDKADKRDKVSKRIKAGKRVKVDKRTGHGCLEGSLQRLPGSDRQSMQFGSQSKKFRANRSGWRAG